MGAVPGASKEHPGLAAAQTRADAACQEGQRGRVASGATTNSACHSLAASAARSDSADVDDI